MAASSYPLSVGHRPFRDSSKEGSLMVSPAHEIKPSSSSSGSSDRYPRGGQELGQCCCVTAAESGAVQTHFCNKCAELRRCSTTVCVYTGPSRVNARHHNPSGS